MNCNSVLAVETFLGFAGDPPFDLLAYQLMRHAVFNVLEFDLIIGSYSLFLPLGIFTMFAGKM
jgi:hypothetical protein